MPDSDLIFNKTVYAADLMSSPVISIRKDATVAEAAAIMLQHRVGAVVVIDENQHYAGMITERMLLPEEEAVPFMRGSVARILGVEVGDFENIEEALDEVRSLIVGDVMSTDHPTATSDTTAAKLVDPMVHKTMHHIVILEKRMPVGMVSRHDLLRLLFDTEDSGGDA